MEIKYIGNVDIEFGKKDLDEIFDGRLLSERAFGFYSKRFIEINVFSSSERFCSFGGLAEGFDEESFQGWVLERLREQLQLAFPWGEEKIAKDYSTLDIKISRPALRNYLIENRESLERTGHYFCGIARGIASGHIIDRIHLHFSIFS